MIARVALMWAGGLVVHKAEGLELGCTQGPEIVELAREAGLLINAPPPHCLRFMPALNSTLQEIREGLQLLRRILAKTL